MSKIIKLFLMRSLQAFIKQPKYKNGMDNNDLANSKSIEKPKTWSYESAKTANSNIKTLITPKRTFLPIERKYQTAVDNARRFLRQMAGLLKQLKQPAQRKSRYFWISDFE